MSDDEDLAARLRAEVEAAVEQRGTHDYDRELEIVELEVLWRDSPGFTGRWP